jgi:hypothetical protein
MSTVVVEEGGSPGSQKAQGLILTTDDTHLCSILNTLNTHTHTHTHTHTERLTASSLTTVSIFLTEGSESMLRMISPAGRERVRDGGREYRLGEEPEREPPLVRTM